MIFKDPIYGTRYNRTKDDFCQPFEPQYCCGNMVNFYIDKSVVLTREEMKQVLYWCASTYEDAGGRRRYWHWLGIGRWNKDTHVVICVFRYHPGGLDVYVLRRVSCKEYDSWKAGQHKKDKPL